MTYFNECYYFGVLCEFNVFLCYCVFVADAGEHFYRFDFGYRRDIVCGNSEMLIGGLLTACKR